MNDRKLTFVCVRSHKNPQLIWFFSPKVAKAVSLEYRTIPADQRIYKPNNYRITPLKQYIGRKGCFHYQMCELCTTKTREIEIGHGKQGW